tara:strand:+ start:548 stop:931 length:384 start_codon:yes stop_codon:yes gene_type:complete
MMMMGPGWGFFMFPFAPLLLFLAVGVIGIRLSRRRSHDALPRDRHPTSADGHGDTRSATPATLYRLASRHGGVITVSTVVIDLGVTPAEAEEALQAIADEIRVRMEVRDDGRVVYRFLELEDDSRGQ